jgi:hypothetical protein
MILSLLMEGSALSPHIYIHLNYWWLFIPELCVVNIESEGWLVVVLYFLVDNAHVIYTKKVKICKKKKKLTCTVYIGIFSGR